MLTCKIELNADLSNGGRTDCIGETPNASTVYQYITIDHGRIYVADPDNSNIVKWWPIDLVKVTKLS